MEERRHGRRHRAGQGHPSGSYGSYPRYLDQRQRHAVLRGQRRHHGSELWKTDGTAAGTVLVKDIRSGASGSYPHNLTNVNGTLFFTANDGTNGYELWKSDGTAAARCW